MTATVVPLPLKVDGKPIRVPRRTPPRGPQRPAWSDYRVKVPVDCDHCCQVAYDTAMTGGPYDGLRKARRKRRQLTASDVDILLLCHEHGRIQQALDDDNYGHLASEGRSNGKRYIA